MKYIIAKPHSIYELGKRANQEDNIYPEHGLATSDDSLFIVCDGMGGHESGEVASSTVCEEMSKYINEHFNEYIFNVQNFQEALDATFDVLDSKDNGAEKKMGTTMIFMKFHSEGCLMAHIGDSRMYHIRSTTKEMLFKSRDHSLVNDLLELGELTEEEAKNSKQKNIITRAIQPNQERRVKAAVKLITDIQVGDYFYICTDGMLEQMDDENIVNIISMDIDDDEKIRILTDLTVENKDNHSAYLIRVEGVEKTINDDVIIIPTDDVVDENVETKAPLSKTLSSKVTNRSKQPVPKRNRSLLVYVLVLIAIFAMSFFMYRIFATKDNKQTVKIERVEDKAHKHNTKNIDKKNRKQKEAGIGVVNVINHANEDTKSDNKPVMVNAEDGEGTVNLANDVDTNTTDTSVKPVAIGGDSADGAKQSSDESMAEVESDNVASENAQNESASKNNEPDNQAEIVDEDAESGSIIEE